MKIEASKSNALAVKPKIVVTVRDKEGKDNALVVAYCGNCSYDPPMVMVGIVPSRYSHHMSKETGEFVVNLVPESLREKYAYLGSTSRKDEDKLSKSEMKYEKGVKVNAPILLNCPVNIECTVVDSIITGSHEMFIGKVEYVHADENLVDNEGNIDYSKIDLLKFR